MIGQRSLRSRLFSWAGLVVVLLSLGFVALKLRASWGALSEWQPTGTLVLAVVGAGCGYALMGFLLSAAWHLLAGRLGRSTLSARAHHSLYARSQIAKYVPGNVLHLAGRHALSRRAGESHAALVVAALYEVAGLLTAAASVCLVGVATVSLDRSRLPLVALGGVVALALLTLTAIAATHPAVRRRLALPERRPAELVRAVGGALGLYLLFFVAGGILLVWLVLAVGGAPGVRATGVVIAAFSLAWAAGFLTPGAPAGLGVREAALVAALGGLVGQPTALLAALALRVVTVLGDTLFFTGSFLWGAAAVPAGGDAGDGETVRTAERPR